MRRLLSEAKPLFDGGRALARLLPKVDRRRLLLLLAAALVLGAVPVAAAVDSGVLIGRLDRGGDAAPAVGLVLALPFFYVLREVASQAIIVIGGSLGRRVDAHLRERVMRVSLDPPGTGHLDDPKLGAVIGAARNLSPFTFSPGDAAQQLGLALAPRIQAFLAMAVLAWWYPLLAAAALVVWALGQLLAVTIVIRLVSSAGFSMLTPEVVYLRDVVLTPPAAKEIRVFGLGPWFTGRYTELNRERMALSLAKRRGQLAGYALAGGVLGAGLTGSLLWVGARASHASLPITTVGVLVLVLLNLYVGANLMPDIPIIYGTFAVAAIEDAERAVASRPDPVTHRATTTIPLSPGAGLWQSIELRNVRYSYPGSDRPVLDRLNLEIPAGQRLAIVGLNGAGKTTLVKLVCGLLDPEDGEILVDGLSLGGLDARWWHSQISALFQDFIHFQLSARDNVRFGADDGAAALAELRQAARRAGALSLIESLPSGWETPLSAGLSGGLDLSGGQWQRVALARAMDAVNRGARLLILDEPTANLDGRAEQEFFESVLARTGPTAEQTVTTVLISHRFATVRHADRIVVIADGRVVEDGTHDDLLRLNGSYASMFHAQAASFLEDDGATHS